ncbi:glycosyltransferase [Kocuria rhizophila]|uniref:glycosyltransferase n=1 Tax=Kocuria rhizophila TaxID=72000 RepID=UPI003D6DC853
MHSDERPDETTHRRALAEHVRDNPEGFLIQFESALDDLAVVRATLDATNPADDGSAAGQDTPARASVDSLGQCSTVELVAGLERHRSITWLVAALRKMYYEEGALREPNRLMNAHPELVAQLTGQDRALAHRIRSAVELWDNHAGLVPQRCSGAAVRGERDRVMYCAHSTPAFHSNGYSTRTHGLAVGSVAAGTDLHVVSRIGYPWDTPRSTRPLPPQQRHTVEIDGVTWIHHPGPALGSTGAREYILAAADAFVREARNVRPTMIHAASNFMTGLPALIAARRLGVPFVYEVRGLWEITEASVNPGWETSDRFSWQRDMESFVTAQADRVLAITPEAAAELVHRGAARNRIDLLPNGVDSDTFLPLPFDADLASRLKLPTDRPIIGFAGSFVAYEGLELLLEAAEELVRRDADFHIVLAGGGGVEQSLVESAAARGLGDHVTFAGRLDMDDVPRLLGCLDAVCCPRLSLPVTEMVSPLKPLEAFAAGKPVVMSDVSPHRMLAGVERASGPLSVGTRGVLHRPDDAQSLADALQHLLADRDRRLAMGRRARRWVREHRRWLRLGAGVRDTYREAQRYYEASCEDGVALRDLSVAVIADEFTTRALQPSVAVTVLERATASEQIVTDPPDIVFIESAWNGNGGTWHRGVGHYSDSEDADLAAVIATCNEHGVPTVFWNKEDPVHFQRFRSAALRCDHVFTTDADLISRYVEDARAQPGSKVQSVSSMTFFAQPAIHNPLAGSAASDPTFAYAGTYYGARYPERSAQLARLLEAASHHGLTIYDRQLAVADSPYHFPAALRDHVRGAIPYQDVVASYASHIGHLNANSVSGSPTMFSRRVVEVASSGGVVLSTSSRAVDETFNGCIPATNDASEWNALMKLWRQDPDARRAEAWLQMRTVQRSHTADTALIILARTAGLPVRGLDRPSWGTRVDLQDTKAVDRVLRQSWRPDVVQAVADPSEDDDDTVRQSAERLSEAGIDVVWGETVGRPGASSTSCQWWGTMPPHPTRTWAEDALASLAWGAWDCIRTIEPPQDQAFGFLVEADPAPATVDDGCGVLRRSTPSPDVLMDRTDPPRSATSCVTLVMPAGKSDSATSALEPEAKAALPARVLIAGHDLKFIRSWRRHLESAGVEVLVDQWSSHTDHDETTSRQLLARVDTVVCEWGLGNAVWYSHNVQPGQRLVVRVHAQELRGPHLRRIRHTAVDVFVFVGRLALETAVRSHGVPRDRCVVIPNAVECGRSVSSKSPAAERTLGLVGMVPRSKRPDIALDVLELVLQDAPDFVLRIKGKRAVEYPWMRQRAEENEYFERLEARAEDINRAAGRPAVVFDPYGDDVEEWFQDVGFVLSVSDHESFHLSLPDGAANGAVPLALAWPGAEFIYPDEWLRDDARDVADDILRLCHDPEEKSRRTASAQQFVQSSMSSERVHEQLDALLREGGAGRRSSTAAPLSRARPAGDRANFGDVEESLRVSRDSMRTAALATAERLATVSAQLQGQQAREAEMRKKIWWLESQWSAQRQRDTEHRATRDAMQKKIWWLESELRKSRARERPQRRLPSRLRGLGRRLTSFTHRSQN